MSQIDVKIKSANLIHAAGHSILGIERSPTEVLLKFPDGSEFVHLNTHTAKVLEGVIDLPSVQLDALVNLTTLRETICRATKASDATLRVNVNLYGSREARENVGDHLSAGKIYLQHPDQQRPGSTYDNPHVLALPGIQVESVDFKPQQNVLRGNGADQFRKALSDVYASLKRGSHLKRLAGDERLRTSLLP
jgi:SWI/SNF-related matrix-associated actin-dependent regulator of chromatin subfamily A3